MKSKKSKNYYDIEMLSVSTVRLFAQNPMRALEHWNGIENWFTNKDALIYGQYVHAGIEDFLTDSEEALNKLKNEEPSLFKNSGELYAKFKQADKVLEVLKNNEIIQSIKNKVNNSSFEVYIEKEFFSEFKEIKFKGKPDIFIIDKKNNYILAYDFKTSKPYHSSGVDWGTTIEGDRKLFDVSWHSDKLFAWQAGTYRHLIQEEFNLPVYYQYIVATKEEQPRIDIWEITEEAMDYGFELFKENLVKAHEYIIGTRPATFIDDGSPWANKHSQMQGNFLVTELPKEDATATEIELTTVELGSMPSFLKGIS